MTSDDAAGGFNNRNLFSHRSGGKKSEIRVSAGRLQGRAFPGLFQLLGAPAAPWFVAASLQSLSPYSRGLLFSLCLPPCACHKDTDHWIRGMPWYCRILITCAKILILNKVTCTGSGGRMWTCFGGAPFNPVHPAWAYL